MKQTTDFERDIVEHPDVGIVMPDGCRLSARIWLPRDAEQRPVPAILEHLPYRKRDGTVVRDTFTHPWFAGHGYACIRTDMRGNGESDGFMEDEYTSQELDDACAVIAWAAAQTWCNGNVGMMGISWGGFNGLQVAALQPPALKAVISICSTVDRYADDIHTKGGCQLVENFGWAANMLSYSSRPPDEALVGEQWRRMWLERLDKQPFLLSTWLRHQHRDEYWKHGSVCEDYSAIDAAVLAVGGWHDGYRNTMSHLVSNLTAPTKGIAGPWNHKYPHYAGPKPAIGFLQEAKRWWDRWLKGEDNDAETDPAYRAWLMDSLPPKRRFESRPGRWVAEQHWPSPTIDRRELHLQPDGKLGSDPTSFSLDVSSPQTCGAAGGEYFPFAFGDELPDEQSADDAGSACFDSVPLDVTTDIVGAPRICLRIAADKPCAQIAVRLCDLRPDGTSAFISHGVFNLTHHRSHEAPQPLKPGKAIDVAFDLDQIAYRLFAGHRLRIAVSTAYWPSIWPSPEVAAVTLRGGTVGIPIRPTAGDSEWVFEEPEGAPPWRHRVIRQSSYSRMVSRDDITGEVVTTIESDFGENEDLDHGLISGSWMRERFSILPDDPLSARAEAEWEQTGGRAESLWRTHVRTTMQATRTHFVIGARLEAFENGAVVFERLFEDMIERNLV